MATVRKRPAVESKAIPQAQYNRYSNWKNISAATGLDAIQAGRLISEQNKENRASGKAPKVVKVDSNPVKAGRTRIGNLAGGLGGMFGAKNR